MAKAEMTVHVEGLPEVKSIIEGLLVMLDEAGQLLRAVSDDVADREWRTNRTALLRQIDGLRKLPSAPPDSDEPGGAS